MSRLPRDMAGVQMSLADLSKWIEEADFPPKQQQQLERMLKSYQDHIRSKQQQKYRGRSEELTQERDRLSDEIAMLVEVAQGIAEGLENGTVDVRAGRRDLTTVFRDLEHARGAAARLRENDDQSWEEVSTDPREAQAQQLERFPSLRGSLPSFKEEHFTPGSREPSPFADRR